METIGTQTRQSFTVAKKLEVIEAYETRFNYNLSHTAAYFDLDKIPGGFTSTLQTIDVSINKPFKQYYQELYYKNI